MAHGSYMEQLRARYAEEERAAATPLAATSSSSTLSQRLAAMPPLQRIPLAGVSLDEDSPSSALDTVMANLIPVPAYLARKRMEHPEIAAVLNTLAPTERQLVRALIEDHSDAFDTALLQGDAGPAVKTLTEKMRLTAVMLGDPAVSAERAADFDRCDFDHELHASELGAAVQAGGGALPLDKNIISKAIAAIKKRRLHAKTKRAGHKADRAREDEERHTQKNQKTRGDTSAPAPTASETWEEYRLKAAAAPTAAAYDASIFERIKAGARKVGTFLGGPRSTLIARPFTSASKARSTGVQAVGAALLATEVGRTLDPSSISGGQGVQSEKGARFTMEVHGAKKRATGTLFSGKARVPMTRVALGDGSVLDYYVVPKGGEVPVTKAQLLSSTGGVGYVGQQLDMHLKGGSVSIKPDFGRLRGAPGSELADRIWLAESSGKKGDAQGVFLRFGAGGSDDGGLEQELTEVAIVWDAKQAKRMKAVAAIADFIDVGAASPDALASAEAIIAAYAVHTSKSNATNGAEWMARMAPAGTVLSTALGRAFDEKHLEAAPAVVSKERAPSAMASTTVAPEVIRDLAAHLADLADVSARDDLDVSVNDLLAALMPAMATNQATTGKLLSQLAVAHGAAYLQLDEATQRIHAVWKRAAEATGNCATLAADIFGWK